MSPHRHLASGLLAALLWPTGSIAVDFVAALVQRETVVSASGAYTFDIELARRWRVDPATGTLRAIAGGQAHTLWQRSLPQRVRPRFASAADDGTVVLFDQFDNIKGPTAVLLVNPQGHDVVRLTFDEIARAIGATESRVLHQAKHGAWIQTLPRLTSTEALVGVAGRTLSINLATGQTQVAPR
ncbi:hypothetical protein [Accumulibacter sp.]|uniref:hypothetical protein n=1 Tax=Accumulibacter sp. TaxID=2053492 RepID=UPI002628D6A9|nr:hypothetical protein [Accumulibacter sp.]